MCERFLALAVLFLGPAVFPSTGTCQESQDKAKDAGAIIQQTSDLYRNLRNYQLERTTTIAESQEAGKEPQVTKIKFLTASIGAKQLNEGQLQLPLGDVYCNLTMEVDGKKVVLITNDHEGWWYSARENQYKKGHGFMVMGSVGSAVFISFHSFPFLNLDKDLIREPRIVREATAEVGKQSRPCYVIEGNITNQKIEDLVARAVNATTLGKAPALDPKVSALGMEMLLNMLQMQANFGDGQSFSFYAPKDDATKITLWIDKANHTLVQSEMSANFKKGGFRKDKSLLKDEEMLVTITDAFNVIKINEQVPKELFQFTPPAGATEKTHESDAKPK